MPWIERQRTVPGPIAPIVDLGISGRVAAGGSHDLFLSRNDFPVCETGITVSWPAVAGVAYSIRVGSQTGEKGIANLRRSIDTPQRAGDLNASAAVNLADLAAIFGSWGPCADCAADIDRSGVVNGDDLAIRLAGRGPC